MFTDASGALILVMEIVGPLILLAALIYGTMMYRRRSSAAKAAGDAATKRLYQQDNGGPSAVRPGPPVNSSLVGDPTRYTEDEIARRNLGGTRGAPELGEAPLVPQQAENTPRKVKPGHTA